MNQRIGIIDIGSNSVRLVIYETTWANGYRVIDESKESARLSERIDHNGVLQDPHIKTLAEILCRFKMICAAHHVSDINAVATAAIRNASNQHHIMTTLKETTSLNIRCLSGEEEALPHIIRDFHLLTLHHNAIMRHHL